MTFEDRLLKALQERVADGRPQARHRPAAVLAGAAAVLTIAVAVMSVSAPSPAIAVERDDEWITVRLLEVAADPAKVERELRAAGIEAAVIVEPAPPELIGRWTRVAFSVDGPVGEADEDELRIPVDVTGPVEIGLGREAQPGEQPVMLAPRPNSSGCGAVERRGSVEAGPPSADPELAHPACD